MDPTNSFRNSASRRDGEVNGREEDGRTEGTGTAGKGVTETAPTNLVQVYRVVLLVNRDVVVCLC